MIPSFSTSTEQQKTKLINYPGVSLAGYSSILNSLIVIYYWSLSTTSSRFKKTTYISSCNLNSDAVLPVPLYSLLTLPGIRGLTDENYLGEYSVSLGRYLSMDSVMPFENQTWEKDALGYFLFASFVMSSRVRLAYTYDFDISCHSQILESNGRATTSPDFIECPFHCAGHGEPAPGTT